MRTDLDGLLGEESIQQMDEEHIPVGQEVSHFAEEYPHVPQTPLRPARVVMLARSLALGVPFENGIVNDFGPHCNVFPLVDTRGQSAGLLPGNNKV